MLGSDPSKELVPKPKTTSAVWQYFGFIANEEGRPKNEQQPICKLCKKTVLSRGSNTSNLFAHLRANHPSTHQLIKKAKPSTNQRPQERSTPTITESLMRAQSYARTSKKWQRLTESVAFCLAKDSLPLYSVEKPGFRRMVRTFDPQFELPSRKHFSNTAIPNMYEETRGIVARELQEVEYFSGTIPEFHCPLHLQ